jgi:hypothetical protein
MCYGAESPQLSTTWALSCGWGRLRVQSLVLTASDGCHMVAVPSLGLSVLSMGGLGLWTAWVSLEIMA